MISEVRRMGPHHDSIDVAIHGGHVCGRVTGGRFHIKVIATCGGQPLDDVNMAIPSCQVKWCPATLIFETIIKK